MTDDALPLGGVRVVDVATVIAGPGAAARLGDFGADVIKVEHPRVPDPVRGMGWSVDDVTLWSKWIGRNKRPVTLDLSNPAGAELLRRLLAQSDVLVESFRPGTLERWDLAPESLLTLNPGLIVLRISGFGQTGPYRTRPGFGTLAESMSGYAHMTGFPDGPPVLPPVALADETSALLGAFAVMVALYRRDTAGGGRGRAGGQVIDLSLFEALFHLTGPVAAAHDKLGVVPGRIGNRIAYVAPRGAYPTREGRWVGISGTSEPTAMRIFDAMGRADLKTDPRFATNTARVANVEELDRVIAAWTIERTLDEVIEVFERHHAPAAPVHDIAGIARDPQYRARRTLVRVPDEELGDVLLADAQPRLSATPGRIRHAGRQLGSANDEVYGDLLGLSADEQQAASESGAI